MSTKKLEKRIKELEKRVKKLESEISFLEVMTPKSYQLDAMDLR